MEPLTEELARINGYLVRRGYPHEQIADISGVSRNSIEKLVSRPDEIIRSVTTSRKRNASRNEWLRIISQLAISLGESPESWLIPESWGLKPDAEELEDAISKAREKLQKHARISGELGILKAVRVIILPIAPFNCSPKRSQESDESFLGEFVRAAVGSVSPSAKLLFSCESNLSSTIPESDESQKTELRAGVLKIMARELGRLDHIPIPGFQIKMSCVMRKDLVQERGVSWDRIVSRRLQVKMLSIKNSSTERFLKGCMQFSDTLDRSDVEIFKYEIGHATKELKKLFQEKNFDSPTAFLTDESFFWQLKRSLRKESIEIVDVCNQPRTVTPFFPLTLQVNSKDKEFIRLLREVIQGTGKEQSELYTVGASIIAPKYASVINHQLREQSFRSWIVLDESASITDGEKSLYDLWREYFSDLLSNTSPVPPYIPSFARISDFHFAVPEQFVFAFLDNLYRLLFSEEEVPVSTTASSDFSRQAVRKSLQLFIPPRWSLVLKKWIKSRIYRDVK